MKRKTAIHVLSLLCWTWILPEAQAQSASSFVRFQLIQGGTKTVFATLTNNAVIEVPSNTAPNFNLEVVTTGGPITSILFGYNDNANYRVEKTAPYALCGDNAGIFKSCTPPDLGIGTHRVNATISNTGQSAAIRFQIVTAAPTPAKTPVVAPVPTPVKTPVVVPVPTPVKTPVVAPVSTPVVAPVPAPVKTPVVAPVPTAAPPTPILFTLIYTANNTDIQPLVNGSVVNLNDFAQASFNIRAEAIDKAAIQSIRFLPINRSQTAFPWSYCGTTANGTIAVYRTCTAFTVEGQFTITARPYSGRQLSGTQLPDVTITFYLVGQPRPPTITTFPFFINCGGPTFSDSQRRTWVADSYFTDGKTYSNSTIDVVNTVDDTIYQSERYGIFVYQIPIPIGSYSVILHLAEIL